MERLEDVIAAAIARLYVRERPRIILAGSNLAGSKDQRLVCLKPASAGSCGSISF